MTENETNPIEAVRERLDGGRNWHKGSLQGPEDSVCIMGALNETAASGTRGKPFEVLNGVVGEQYPDRMFYGPWIGPAAFNDHPDTTWADVDLVLNKASIAWDETVR